MNFFSQLCNSPVQLLQIYLMPEQVSLSCKMTLMSISEQPSGTSLLYYLAVFFLTCSLESPFYFLALRGRSLPNRFLATFFANLCTHPLVFFAFPSLGAFLGVRQMETLVAAEVFAPVVEAAVLIGFWKVPWTRAALFMVLANLFSWGLGIYLERSLSS